MLIIINFLIFLKWVFVSQVQGNNVNVSFNSHNRYTIFKNIFLMMLSVGFTLTVIMITKHVKINYKVTRFLKKIVRNICYTN